VRLQAFVLLRLHALHSVKAGFCWLASRLARFVLGTPRIQHKAPVILLAALACLAQAATPPGMAITNTATASYTVGGNPFSVTGSNTTTTAARTPAVIQFLQYVPSGPDGSDENVATTMCNGLPMVAPNYAGPPAVTLNLSNPVRLKPTSYYSNGDPLFVKVTDYDQNTNPTVAETIVVTITTPIGDSESLTLTETGVSTGVFIGYIQSNHAASATTNDCGLTVATDQTITASYTDPADFTPTVTASALVDPFGLLFDSATGAPISGASVSLIDDSTGLTATVYCDDGVATLTQPIQSGATNNCDPVAVPAGAYRFPRVSPGTYRLTIIPPSGYAFPSTAATLPTGFTVIGTATGGGASYGSPFPLNPGPAVKIDVPLDPTSGGDLQITKSAGKSVVSFGDFVPYTLTIHNNGAADLPGVQIADRLPQGFRYQSGSAKLDGTPIANPSVSIDGRTLTFNIGNLAANATVNLRYVAQVSAGSRLGNAENVASATGSFTSNTARAFVLVHEELPRNRAILIGRVIVGSCDDKVDNDIKGLANARVLLEDGRYVQTDQEGRWHMDDIRPGTHVVQLDLDSLPEGYEAQTCEKNTRFAGRNFSQFVKVRGGTLWRADFHVRKRAPESICLDQKLGIQRAGEKLHGQLILARPTATDAITATFMLPAGTRLLAGSVTLNGKHMDAQEQDGVMVLRLPAALGKGQDQINFDLQGTASQGASIKAMIRAQVPGQPAKSMPVMDVPIESSKPAQASQCSPLALPNKEPEAPFGAPAQKQLQLVEILPYDDKWLATAQPGIEWLHPRADFSPNLPVIKIAIKLAPTQKAELRVNGEAVSPLNYDGMTVNSSRTVGLATWRGVPIRDGANKIDLEIKDANGKVVHSESRTIHYAVGPETVSLVEQQSRLVADGKTRPVLAVRFDDKDGYPVRKGVNGEFQINEPYQAWDKLEGIERQPLNGRIGGKPRYEITADGTALIELQPTTQSGEVVLTFQFNDKQKQEIRAWLKPSQRDWVLVGFAEGTLGHKQLSGNMENLKGAGADDKLFDGNQVAFYAKGTIKGEYLLTMAYDTAKSRGDAGSLLLKGAVDPNQYYTLYADATQPQFDAASARKLYLKIEKNQFYALFGDYDTGLTVTEFSRYSRTLNGLKSEYKGEKLSYSAFATLTAQAYVRDEIQGDGTSGLYKLSRSNIVINSDKVRIETRDRFHSEVVVSSTQLTRYLDYDIDTAKGTLFFHEPIQSKDDKFNPTYIVAEYESESSADEKPTYGGRVAYKPMQNLEVGLTHIHEGNVGATGNLTGADLSLKLDDTTTLKAELAHSNEDISGTKSDGTAWKIEALRESKDVSAHVYLREQQDGFGLGQQAGGETGTRKVGADARLKLSETLDLQGEIYRQDTLSVGATRDQAEGQVQWHKDNLSTHAGLRLVQDTDGLGKQLDSRQATAGVAYQMLDKKLTLKADSEINLSGNAESVDFPNRIIVGADYKITQQTSLFADQEFARGNQLSADTTRIGLRTQPWSGGELAASLGNQYNLDSGRLFADMGLIQKWQINEFWQADFGVDRTQTLKSTGVVPLNTNVPLTSGSLAGDYTALFAGASFNDKTWSANGRVEWRTSDTDDKINVLVGLQRNLDAGRSMAAGLTFTRDDAGSSLSRNFDGRLSYAYRPWNNQWIWLDRADYIDEIIEDTSGGSHARKLINNLNANWKPDIRTQVAFQYGAKYVLDRIDGSDYDGYTDLVSIELRHDLSQSWDVGVHAGALHSWNGGQIDYNLGASVGYRALDNTWVSVGYNVLGFTDNDFSGAEYRSKGPYANISMKFDQDTLGLNNPNGPSLLKY
jgi:uncharacterized repeat protein (TIGR01451 family)